MTRYAIIRTASYDGSFSNAVNGVQVPTSEGVTCFVRRIGIDRSRSCYGQTRVTVFEVVDGQPLRHKPLTWATREAAEAVAANHTSAYTTYAVQPLEVVAEYDVRDPANEHHIVAHAETVPGAWIETKGLRARVLRTTKAVPAVDGIGRE